MNKNLNLSMVATLVIVALSCTTANAKSNQPSAIDNQKVQADKQNEQFELFVNNQQRSLYQIALLSGVSITELRQINKGDYDEVDVVKIGDTILLPATSPLLPAKTTEITKEDKYSYLPSLGSSSQIDNVSDDEVIERHIATVLQTLGQQDWENMSSDKVKQDLQNQTQSYAENYVRSQVNAQLVDPLRSAAQNFLGRFGTAQLQFDISDKAQFNNVNLKLFSPWYDSENMLIFSQLTYQEYEQDRRIANFGVGQRWDVADKSWLLGYNVFFDHDLKRKHNRLGLGLEAWSDYMKFAANYYHPLSDWKDSKDFDDYLERAAKGFDIRFQGYLPSYPHLGGSLMFEQYFGDEVALFGKDNLQRDPYAFTVGVDYTPVPLFTIKGEHKQGEGSSRIAKAELTMNYRIGVPLKDQLDPAMVEVARSLKGSRYDLVDRNNFIVLEYKEKKFSVDLASLGEFEEQSIVPVGINVRNAKSGVTIVRGVGGSWNQNNPIDITALGADGGDLCYNRGSIVMGSPCPTGNLWSVGHSINDIDNWSILVPDYLSATGERNPTMVGISAPGRYTFDITLTDGKGRTATSNTSWLAIKPNITRRQVHLDNISIIPVGGTDKLGSSTDPAPANGIDTVTLEGKLWDSVNNIGFNDALLFADYPNTTTTPTEADIIKLNQLYSVISSTRGNVVFVDGIANTTCAAASQSNCLLVKGITKTAGSPDSYKIDVATTAALGKVTVSFNVTPYIDSSTTTTTHQEDLYFSAGAVKLIRLTDITNGGSTVVFEDKVGTGVLTWEGVGGLTIGNTYQANIYYDSAGALPVPATTPVTWSLVGDNVSACGTSNTILPDASITSSPTGPWFNVHTGLGVTTYTLQGVNTSLASTAPYTGISVSSLGNDYTITSPATGACAGDQGFKLQITVQ